MVQGIYDTSGLGGLELNTDATSDELDRVCDVSTRLVTLTGSVSITQATHSDRILLMGAAGAALTFTLPAATGSGARFKFVVSVVNTSNYIIKVADASDTIDGNIITNSTGDTPDLAQPWPTAATDDTITLNGTTTGGVAIGDFVELIDILADQYVVFGVTTTSGVEATPFSATV